MMETLNAAAIAKLVFETAIKTSTGKGTAKVLAIAPWSWHDLITYPTLL